MCPPPPDVHPAEHARHPAQLPRRHRHVLQAQGVRLHRGQRPKPRLRLHGLLTSGSLLLGVFPAPPPASLAATPPVPHGPSPLPPPALGARVAPCGPARRGPAHPRRLCPARAAIRLILRGVRGGRGTVTDCIVGAGLRGLTAGCGGLRVPEPSQRGAQCDAMSSSWASASLKPGLQPWGL